MKPSLLETDQTYCYDTEGNNINCAGSGQDAEQPKKFLLVEPRFEVREDLVLDHVTGALWTRNANPADFPLTWDEARDYVADMSARKEHGLAGWQLPSRRLLFSLISHQRINPTLPQGHPFTNVFTGYYWTADSCSRLPHQAWHIHMGGGRIAKANKVDSDLLWPVCPPEIKPDTEHRERFITIAECVQDTLTGLMWSREAGLTESPLTWEQAHALVTRLNKENAFGHNDWRMPNIRELDSLVDLRFNSPALSSGHPFINVRDACWSSTTSVYESRYAWTLYFRDGMVGVGFKAGADFFLWPVRS